MKKQLFTLLSGLLFSAVSAQVTYKDVAGIFYARCTSCHHSGASTRPFMNYAQTVGYASSIDNDLTTGVMPPWNADTAYTRFQHERIITSSEKQLILDWIAGGALKGDTTLAPQAPVYPTGYQLAGNADLTLSIGQFTSTATTSDKYYCFSLPTGLTQNRIIRAFEVVPGNKPIVHHAVITVDSTGTYTSDLSGNCYNIPGNVGIGTYAPGSGAVIFPGQAPLKAGITLKAGSKIIIQLHYPEGSAGEVDSTKIRLYFYPIGTTGVRQIYTATPLQNWSMAIPPNTVSSFSAYYPTSGTLPVSLSAFAVMPHSHLLCQTIVYYAVKPGIDTIKLVKIKKWNFEWQDYYTFKKLVKIPNGYRLYSKHVYDNTSNNPNNPNDPPITVYSNTGTTDEMLFDGMMYMYYQPGDELIDVQGIMDGDPLLNTGIKDIDDEKFELQSRTFPNPFSDLVTIQYSINETATVSVEIYDLLGKQIIKQNIGKQPEGIHNWDWKANDNGGNKIPAGVYFYKLKANDFIYEGKIIKQN
ncbi:MAG: T9SS type A sorting domain-containing protein [Bacteroidetes bacterium]|nr:T9SS type A sorting domain-containing protein [Bacteroidota bacterium]